MKNLNTIKNLETSTKLGLTFVMIFILPLVIALVVKLSTNPTIHF
jgi:hypothetical protein